MTLNGFIIVGLFTGTLASCGLNICLNWKVTRNTLTLICKVSDLHQWIYFYDPSNKVVADCIPPYPSTLCHKYELNGGTIKQNTKTKETTLMITGTIDRLVNGNWTCQHGTNIHKAYIEVTVFDTKDHQQDINVNKGGLNEVIGKNECIKRTILNGMFAFSSSMLFYICLLLVQNHRLPKVDRIHNKMSDVRRIVLVLICSIFFLVCCVVGGELYMVNHQCRAQHVLPALGLPGGVIVGILLIKIEVGQTEDKTEGVEARICNSEGHETNGVVEEERGLTT